MDHRRYIQLDQFFIQRIPVAVGQRWIGPVTAGRVRIQVAADEAVFLHAAFELGNAVFRTHAGALRQLTHADEVFREQRADAVDQFVADVSPQCAGGGIADVMAHAAGAG